jgi:hypothetical protein
MSEMELSKTKKGKKTKNGKKHNGKKYKTITTCKNKCQKKQAFIPVLPKPLKALNLSAGDLTVCKSGKNLGLLDIGNSCSSTFSQCSRMVSRQPYIPVRSRLIKLKAARGLLKASTKSALKRRPRKRWTLKGRYEKFHPKKELSSQEKDRRRKRNAEKKKQKNLRRWAENVINNRIHTSPITGKSLKKKSKNVVKDMLQGKIGSLKRSLGLRSTKSIRRDRQEKIMKIQKEMNPEHGKYCVQAIEMNLTYCCMFTRRSLAQDLANEQPARPHFTKEVRRGWFAQMRDGERKATMTIRRISKTLVEMNKLRNLAKKQQRKAENKAKAKNGKAKKVNKKK